MRDDRSPVELRQLAEEMVDAIAHRGPDGRDVVVRGPIAIGHARLAVIDIEGGHQPLTIGDQTLTYNGEVYNHQDLRRELTRSGVRFDTMSDTEVVLRAYQAWGTSSFARMEGMFAFAIVDHRTSEVLLVRDGMGVKPLYLCTAGRSLTFASEIKALLSVPDVPRTVDLSAVPHFVAYGYGPRNQPFFREVRSVEPGTYVRWRDGRASTTTWWTPTARTAGEGTLDRTADLVAAAVREHTISDVPVGVLLSGGIDSGIVAAGIARGGDHSFPAFTVEFPTPEGREEVRLARLVADAHRLDHHVIRVGEDDLVEHVLDLLDHFDDPFADCSAVPTYLVSKLARSYVKVVLSGDGGDEPWGGYGAYQRYQQLRAIRRLVRRVPGGRAAVVAIASRGDVGRARRYDHLLRVPAPALYPTLQASIAGDALTAITGRNLDLDPNGPLDVGEAMYADLRGSLVDDMLRKVDMMSMAVGLEVRVPLLDPRLVEHALAVPTKAKVSLWETKRTMRRLAHEWLPAPVAKGAKRGFSFGAALERGMRTSMRPVLEELVQAGRRSHDVLDPNAIRSVIDEQDRGAAHGKLLLSLMALDRWIERFA